MKLLMSSLFLVVLLAFIGSVYANYLVDKNAVQKIDLLMSQSEGVTGNAIQGEYLAAAGGCVACHTDKLNGGKSLAGGVLIETPFGEFYSPNITSDNNYGIGQWSNDDFVLAMSVGLTSNKEHYFPAFPYTSYSRMAVQDLYHLKAWLDTVEPVAIQSREHEIMWPFSSRAALTFWKALYFNPLEDLGIEDRGSYLVNGPGHCGECHTQRNILGGLSGQSLRGNTRGPSGEAVPGISSADLSEWSIEDIELFLEVGITASGDFTGGHMTDVVDYGTSLLTDEDRTSIANYLLSEKNRP